MKKTHVTMFDASSQNHPTWSNKYSKPRQAKQQLPAIDFPQHRINKPMQNKEKHKSKRLQFRELDKQTHHETTMNRPTTSNKK